jgi:glycosyltransferase involved in cell wall biosynthesis
MTEAKTIWIINQYAGSRIHGMNFRSWYFAHEWKKKGHQPYIFSASYSHLFHHLPKVTGKFTHDQVEDIPYVWVKVKNYGPSQSIGRVLVMLQFMWRLFSFPVHSLPKPDIILVSSLSPFPILNAFFWSRKFKAKLIFEVRDIWPLSLIEIGGMSKWHPLVRFIGWFERFAYKRADYVVSVLPKAQEHMVRRGLDPSKFRCVPNGFDPDELKKLVELTDAQLALIPKNKFIVGYTGSLGAANAMEYLIHAAQRLINDESIHFVIVGKGQHKEQLMHAAGKNVTFIDPIPKNQVQQMLKQFDVCYIGWHHHSIYRFGISPNKIFDYLFAGKPIIHSVNAGNDIVQDAQCGFSVPSADPLAIAEAIQRAAQTPPEVLQQLGETGKAYALEHHTYAALADQFLKTT